MQSSHCSCSGVRQRRDEVGYFIDRTRAPVVDCFDRGLCFVFGWYQPVSHRVSHSNHFLKAFPPQLSRTSYAITGRLHSVCFESQVGTQSAKSDLKRRLSVQ